MRDYYRGKCVVITGASGGLGKALCREFGAYGARIVGLDIDRGALDVLKSELDAAGIESLTFACDITKSPACEKATARIVKAFGGVDVLINNAGVTHFSRFRETSPETIRRVVEVNFMGAVNITRALLPALTESQGTIVAMSSVAGFAPLYARTLYSASKHAIHGFFHSLRTELIEEHVRVMIVCPSFIATQAGPTAATPATAGKRPPKKASRVSAAKASTARSATGIARPGQATETAGKPLEPAFVAREISEAVTKNKTLLIVGPLAKKSFFVYKFFPALYERIMIKKMRGELS